MIFRIYPSKDTFITNDFRYPNYTRLTGANVGWCEELDVYKRPGSSGSLGWIGSSSLGRILMQFDMTRFTALTSSRDIPTSGMTFFLRLNHKTHGDTQPESYDLRVRPVSASWDEGRGHDVNLRDNGVANWEKRTSSAYWATVGGDFLASPSASAHFDDGTEDLEIDITPIVNGWLSGTIPNYGLVISMTDTVEANSNYSNYYQKKFYSRHSDYEDRRPYIEVRTSDFVGDDRTNMRWARTGSLFLYKMVGGIFQDLIGLPIVDISDASGTIMSVTASIGGPGTYSASFAIQSGSYSGSLFYDKWRLNGVSLMTGSFTLGDTFAAETLSQYPLTARVRNMQDEYLPEDVAVMEVVFRRKNHQLAVLATASLTANIPYLVENAYYAIENDATRERVIPFGTGSQKHTRLSYGATGNSMKLYMTNLHAGNIYRVIFLVDEQGRRQVIDGGFKFRIV